MQINLDNYQPFLGKNQIYFSKRDEKKILRMRGNVKVVSTVCPDYFHDGEKYVFNGKLGSSASLTALSHLQQVPQFLEKLEELEMILEWLILVADLPELVESQKEFYERVASSKKEYMLRCRESAKNVSLLADGKAEVMTFSDYYRDRNYLYYQEEVAKNILKEAETQAFKSRFDSFVLERAGLARLFRGRNLTEKELRESAAWYEFVCNSWNFSKK